MNTYNIKQIDVKKNWVLIDADGLVLGRLATHIAQQYLEVKTNQSIHHM